VRLSRSYSLATAGVDAFVGDKSGSSLFLFFQGHSEYDTDSLLREYRRDIGRFLRGERGSCPLVPERYFSDDAAIRASDFAARAVNTRNTDLIADFPTDALTAGVENTWRDCAIGVYENWVDHLKHRKAERRPPAAFAPRSGPGRRPLSAG
jgi:homoserine O-succinyltransferase/O-acetyltransferase